MEHELIDVAKWTAVLLVATLGYFLRDAHSSIKHGLEKKADVEALNTAFSMYRSDMQKMEDRYKEETARLERQYDVKFAGVVSQFSERMNGMEKNLADRMDLILRLVNERNRP